MSRKFLTSIDLAKNEIQNAVAQVLASAPGTPKAGQFYYNSTTGRFEYRGASGWIDPTARDSHTGTQLASTISDLTATVQGTRLDQLAAPTASVSLNSQRITNLATPTLSTDAASKGYVDAAVNGTDWKQSVRCATLVDLPALSGLLTIDDITVVAGDRVLVKNQTTASANGIYVAASGAWTRSTDADADAEVTAGLTVMVTEGTSLYNTQWRLEDSGSAIVVGTTVLVFSQIGAGVSYTAGEGITIDGNEIFVDRASPVAFTYAGFLGDGVATSITVVHGFNKTDVLVEVYEVSTGSTVLCEVARISTTQIQFTFAEAPANNSLRYVIHG